jgi:sulfate transport system ATP-binding protein
MSIVVENVSKKFGDFDALNGVSLEVPHGSLTALLGPSGGGKSTLLRVIAGLEEPDAGRVAISGEDVIDTPARKRGVGFVFQHYAAFKHMTVRDNVAFGLKIRKWPKEECRAKVDELLALVHLEGFAERYPAQLSGGQRQRMALARALAVEPKVLLLDEPFGALDATVRKELRLWLRRLHDEVHVTTVFVTHDQEEAMEVAEQIAVLNEGRLEQVGSPRDLYERPANEFVMSFVGPVSRIGDALVRPHDVDIAIEPLEGGIEAMIDRIAHLGFEVRVELTLYDGSHFWAQTTRARADELELAEGHIVYVRPGRTTRFDSAPVPGVGVLGEGRELVGQVARNDVGEAEAVEHPSQVRPERDPDVLKPLG